MTTFGLKAECGRFVQYDTPADDLPRLRSEGVFEGKFFHLGGGSNLLFTTGRYDGTVLHDTCSAMHFSAPDERGEVMVTAAAGCTLDTLCMEACRQGLWGIENLSGIPGHVGGAAVQNVGAYGTELKDVAVAVKVFDTTDGSFRTMDVADCAYGYRDSVFKHLPEIGSLVVVEVTLRLSAIPSPRLGYAALQQQFAHVAPETLTPMMLREAVICLRDSKLPDPRVTGSAGSFFTNPVVSRQAYDTMRQKLNKEVPGHVTTTGDVKLSAAWIIDHAGCKSLRRGGAALWPTQPLVIVNATGEATGNDVTELEQAVCDTVENCFSVRLMPEVVHIC